MRLRKKLQSERGASILLALLMLLVCMMVAASVLAAAASSAGKARSNRVEQQKYLTVSSAIRLVADELQQATYTGKYTVYTWTVETTDSNGIVISTEDFYHIGQAAGEYYCGDLTAQIPLGKELDEIFSKQFTGSGYAALSDPSIEAATVRTLTVELPTGLTGYPYTPSGPDAYKVSDTVTVEVKLDHDTHHIILTAWLGTGASAPADGSNTMIAELVAKNSPVIDYNPAGRTASALTSESGSGTSETTDPMTWQLHWIKKGAA